MAGPSQYAQPILVPKGEDDDSVTLKTIAKAFTPKEEGGYDEAFVQDLVFRHPEALPINEIDPAFEGAIPICQEFVTRAGYVDCLFVNSQGLLTLVECKLWRNPQARREVVGQILDYAKEFGRWKYEDLQREVSKRLGKEGNALFDLVKAQHPELNEADFVDSVARNLKRGRFLLLIVGDGIREGVEAIAEYIQQHSGLHFTFGLVEMPIFELPNGDRIVHPRVLARTAIVERTVVELRDGDMVITGEEATQVEESDDTGSFYLNFWGELLNGLKLDAVDQPVPKPSRIGNISFRLPVPGGYNLWITAYRSQGSGNVGIFVGARRDTVGVAIRERIRADRDAISEELGVEAHWESWENNHPTSVRPYGDLDDPKQRKEVLAWLRDRINRYVNVFRPRVQAIVEEMGL